MNCIICGKKTHFADGKCRKCYFKQYDPHPEITEDVRAKMKAYSQRPDVRAKMKAYFQRPDVRAKKKAYSQRPDVRAKMKAYSQRNKCRSSILKFSKRILAREIKTKAERIKFIEKIKPEISECEYQHLTNFLSSLKKNGVGA